MLKIRSFNEKNGQILGESTRNRYIMKVSTRLGTILNAFSLFFLQTSNTQSTTYQETAKAASANSPPSEDSSIASASSPKKKLKKITWPWELPGLLITWCLSWCLWYSSNLFLMSHTSARNNLASRKSTQLQDYKYSLKYMFDTCIEVVEMGFKTFKFSNTSISVPINNASGKSNLSFLIIWRSA